MAIVNSLEDLVVWQKARALSKEIYWRCKEGSWNLDFELKNQINRSSGSVADNIAEGFEKNGNTEFAFALTIAKGSIGEVRSQLYRAFDRKHIAQDEFDKLNSEALTIIRMIGALRSRLK